MNNDHIFPEDSLDFHDQGKLSPYDIEVMTNKFIEDCYIKGFSTIEIITGVGYRSEKGPVVKPLVLKLIKNNQHVKSFKTHPFKGEGSLLIYLKE